MNTHARAVSLFSISIISFVVCALPLSAYAFGKAADAMCVCTNTPMHPQVPPLCPTVPCFDTGSPTAGICASPQVCAAKTAGGQGVDQGLSQLGQLLGQLLGKLGQGGGSGSGSPATTPTTPLTGCQSAIFQTSDPSQLSNPCAQYVAPATPINFTPSSGTSTCDALTQALGGCVGTPVLCPPVAVDCADGYVSTPQSGVDANNCPLPNQCVLPDTSGNATSIPSGNSVSNILCSASAKLIGLCGGSGGTNPSGINASSSFSQLQSGMTGNIFLQGNGVTITANSLNTDNNSVVAGFYGSNTLGGQQPQSLAANLCQNRPWSAGLFGGIIPASFFDGLCTWQGYQVGTSTPQTAPVVEVQQTTPAPAVSQPVTTAPATTTSSVPAKVQIWAVPASIPLNTRTSIFWSTQGVTNCTETSPDGSFNQTSLSGGAATVPLESATTFTISCADSSGNPVTGYVTVNLSI